ncbi:hypothetical protein C2857_001227 [Epichloe festucae Fl1]|uniref:Uncharacterized protein n=1 Tax=Epichloe festucae (strain Fl1) TaxID=877507 RepID=A0A7S9KJY2_EPIFF|nr:hypothetical protein C2857_001227 [Epichloe festucae Fl1]
MGVESGGFAARRLLPPPLINVSLSVATALVAASDGPGNALSHLFPKLFRHGRYPPHFISEPSFNLKFALSTGACTLPHAPCHMHLTTSKRPIYSQLTIRYTTYHRKHSSYQLPRLI